MILRRPDRFASIAEDYDLLARTMSAERYDPVLASVPAEARRVLDAGCGAGHLALRLARDDRHVVGLDSSPSMLGLAMRHRAAEGARHATFLLADVERPPFADGSFDFVVCFDVLPGERLATVLPILRRLVRPGGRLAIVALVSSWPRLHAWRPRRLVAAMASLPGLSRRHGFILARRLAAFRVRRAIRGPWPPGRLLTPDAFLAFCERALPGCRATLSRRRGTAIWDATAG